MITVLPSWLSSCLLSEIPPPSTGGFIHSVIWLFIMYDLIAYDPADGDYYGAQLDIPDIDAARSAGRDWLTELPAGIVVELHRGSLHIEDITHKAGS